jgi:hypothetical protein
MKSGLSALILALILSVLAVGGCVPASTQLVEVPQATATQQSMEVPKATNSPVPTATPTQVSVKASEPAVAISPTSGPSGTPVQVVASGFPPNTSVSVGVGPENSEYSHAAQGMTDANGVFVVHVPAQGGPGMRLVFAVAAEGQPGISSPDLFQINSAAPTVMPTPSPQVMPSPTPYQDQWITFSSRAYAMSLEYPADWQPVPGYGSPDTGETRYGGISGFFQVAAMDSDSIDQATAAEAEHKLQPYGSQPTVETLQLQGQEARLVLPSDDQPAGMQHQAALIIRYPEPVNVVGVPCRYFVLWADWPHIRAIAQTLRFAD